MIYLYRLHKMPNEIPYEKLSSFYGWKLQQQVILGDLTFLKWAKDLWQLLIVCKLNGLKYKIKYKWLKKPIIWYEYKEKGLFINAGKPDFSKKGKWTKITIINNKITKEIL